MGKYQESVKLLFVAVGGRENIKAVSHCVTRMRFVLCDDTLADLKKIETLPEVKGTFVQSGQFQVIIGNKVQEFYNEFVQVNHLESPHQEDKQEKDDKTFLQKLMNNIGEIFAPIIPAIICAGLMIGLSQFMDSVYLFENGQKTLIQVAPFWGGVHQFFVLISEAVFHFLPVAIVWSITKKMQTTQILGIVLGLTLISPRLLENNGVWDFGLIKVAMLSYQSQVIPAILAGFTLAYLEKTWRKITPVSISMIIVPLFSLLPAVLFTHLLLGPIGMSIGNALAHFVWLALTCEWNWLIGGLIGFGYAWLVITGLHHVTLIIDIQLICCFGGTLLWPILALSNIAQGSAVLGMAFLQRKDAVCHSTYLPACLSCYLGVSEPALFGVNLKHRFPFVCALIGSTVAGMVSLTTTTTAASIGIGGILGLLSILPQDMPTFIIAMFVAITIPALLTYVVGKKKLQPIDIDGDKVFYSPATGRVIPLEQVDDQVFSQGLMGSGFAIELKDSQIVAPFNGEVTMIFPTKHAYGLKRTDGLEVLIHLGMDTVQLNGQGFESLVQVGDQVKIGQPIVHVDLDYIQQQKKSLVSPIVVTSGETIQVLDVQEIKANQKIVE